MPTLLAVLVMLAILGITLIILAIRHLLERAVGISSDPKSDLFGFLSGFAHPKVLPAVLLGTPLVIILIAGFAYLTFSFNSPLQVTSVKSETSLNLKPGDLIHNIHSFDKFGYSVPLATDLNELKAENYSAATLKAVIDGKLKFVELESESDIATFTQNYEFAHLPVTLKDRFTIGVKVALRSIQKGTFLPFPDSTSSTSPTVKNWNAVHQFLNLLFYLTPHMLLVILAAGVLSKVLLFSLPFRPSTERTGAIMIALLIVTIFATDMHTLSCTPCEPIRIIDRGELPTLSASELEAKQKEAEIYIKKLKGERVKVH